jgi:hypothetical protein
LLNCIRIDTRTLAVFRILAGVLIVADLLVRSRTFSFHYVEDGVAPQWLAESRTPENAFSFYFLTTDPTITALLFVIPGIIAIALIVGFWTRIATILSFLFVISLDYHNPFVLSHADTLFRFLMFWAIFLPLGDRWSIDAIHRNGEPRGSVANLASAAILLQMLYMYMVNGYHKVQSEAWTTGTATPLIFGLDDITYLLGDFMRNFIPLLEYGGWLWYYMMLMSWLLLITPSRLRMLLVGLYAGAHASFAITVRIGAFPYVALAGVILFLPTQFWDDARSALRYFRVWDSYVHGAYARLERTGHALARFLPNLQISSPRTRLYGDSINDMATTLAVVAVLIIPGIAFLGEAGLNEREQSEAEVRIEDTVGRFGVKQAGWTIFAPITRTIDRDYVFPARTADGELLDIYNDRPLTFDRPYAQLNRQYFTYRDRFYMNSVRRAGDRGDKGRGRPLHRR